MTTTQARPRSPFALRDFRLLWLGEAVSALGDQFALIALPWLALVLTGDGFALGSVLALMAVPRAVLMLIGGAYVDRLSPRLVMLGSNAVRLVAVAGLGIVVLQGGVTMWMLYVFALVFGIADAFFYPAQTAIVPELIKGEQLQSANGIVQGTAQLAVLIGPALAGLVIAGLSSSGSTPGLTGIGLALTIDALTFVVSMVTLLFIAPRPARATSQASVVRQIAEGIGFVWRAPAIRTVMILSMGANLLIVGPLDVGLPMLAYDRLPEGAAAFGLILSAFGGGSLVGMIGSSVLPPLPARLFGAAVVLLISLTGVSMVGMAFVESTIVALAISGAIGVVLGYTNITYMTWAQRRIPAALMGRVMGLMMFSSMALVPISMAISGALVSVSLSGLLIVGGVGMTLLAWSGLLSHSVRQMGFQPPLEEEESADLEETTPLVAVTAGD